MARALNYRLLRAVPGSPLLCSAKACADAGRVRCASLFQDVVICGAGIAGCAAAYHLTRLGVTNVVVISTHTPLTLTSAYSTECYRDYWPTYVYWLRASQVALQSW